ncbi:MAG: ABC transporter substrate-binding protein [Nocardioidaceae bacterium]|nr:ABC transporter substrate-binding protein [Nocardioidaceae bacterium]
MARKHHLRQLGVLTVTAVLALTACNPSSDTEGSSAGEPLIVARTGDIDGRDPAVATAFQTVQTLDLVYDTLIDTTDAGDLEPSLATKWDVSEDGQTVTLTLREGVTFHNGADFTAADAKATIDRVMDPDVGSVVASNLVNVSEVRAEGDTTLVFELKQPDTALLRVLASTGTAILDEKDISADRVGREVNGTGAFRWGSWDQGQQVTLEANEDYWGDVPEFETVELRVIPDESSILSGMNAGSFDLGIVSDPSVAQQVDTEAMQLLSQPTLSYHALMLNGRRGPLTKLPVRQAIACALDRQQVVKTAYFGQAEVTGPITSPGYEYDDTEGLPCDPPDLDAAEDLLADAGYPDGFTLETIVMVGEYATATNVAQSVQGQLDQIGVELDLQEQQTNVYVDNWLEADYDAAVALNGGSTDPYLMYGRYYTSDASLTKPAGLTDAGLDRLLTQANSTTDEALRQQLFGDLQQRLLELSPWVWLQQNQSYYLVGPDVAGFKALPTESLEYLTTATWEDAG